MHKQTGSSRDEPRINASPRNPSAEARKRRGQEGKEETEKERRNGAEGENPNQIKTKLDVQGRAQAPERSQLAVAFVWLMWLLTEDQRTRGRI